MRQRFRVLVALALVAGLGIGAAGCAGARPPAAPSDVPGADALDKAQGVTTVEFWHSMKGADEIALKALVDGFNGRRGGRVVVTPVYTGSYDETIARYQAAAQQGGTPALVQIYEIGTRYMVDSKQTIPMYKFVNTDRFKLDEIEPNIAYYYSIGGRLQSMPFNTSTPLLYLNKEAFDRAGLDIARPPTTLDELTEYARRLTVKDAAGKTVQYGFGAANFGWFTEQWLATDNAQYCDNGNGRAALATKVQFDSPTGVRIAQWWADLVRAGYAPNLGRKRDDGQAAFKAGTVAMHLESTSVLRGYVDASKGRFTVVTAAYPKVDGASRGGPTLGGASLWISGPGHSDAQKRAAWEFAKFVTQPVEQAEWHAATGYVPVNREALDGANPLWATKYPQFGTAVRQLHALPPSAASAGCLLGVMPQARKAAEDGVEATILGRQPAARAMTAAAAAVTPAIEEYNRSVR